MSDDEDYVYLSGSEEETEEADSEPTHIFHENEIWATLEDQAGQLGELLERPLDCAVALLHLHRWSAERVCQRWLQPGEAALCEVAAGLSYQAGECAICCEVADLLRLEPCGHSFCVVCWQSYLDVADEDRGHRSCILPCMAGDCDCVLTGEVWRAVGRGERYRRLSVHRKISVGDRMRRCAAPECPWVLCISPFADIVAVQCHCGQTCCVRCGREWHAPARCAAMEQWEDKCASESQTGNWLAVNTKPCPRCRTRIQKNQGCNHMRCTQCDYHFCWVCMESWNQHGPATGGYYQCNRFQSTEQLDQTAIKTQLERYLHYYYRYQNHGLSRRQTEQQLQQLSPEAPEEPEVREALRQVCCCRRTLAHTYVACYYAPAGPERTLLEDQQEQLEALTERLTEMLERSPVTDATALCNLAKATETFRQNVEEELPVAGEFPSPIAGESQDASSPSGSG
jgi:ariadne-1